VTTGRNDDASHTLISTCISKDVAADSSFLLGGIAGTREGSHFKDSTTSQLPTTLASATIMDTITADCAYWSIGGTSTRGGSRDSPFLVRS
jgi:hypothetical protein